jgi:hypothetical protein
MLAPVAIDVRTTIFTAGRWTDNPIVLAAGEQRVSGTGV